ncbi:MAG: DUF4358 domain-containing protein [Ruminiclostridium sp.]|nr:DUF4358 domain-containing protein [Ruminiclostridium sp.]
MDKIKKTAALTAAVLMIAGCGGKPEKPPEIVHNTVSEETTPAPEETTAAGELKKYIITCGEVAEKALAEYTDKLPNTMEVTDEVMLTDVLGYDMSLADDYCVYMQMISTDLFELTLIRAQSRNGNLINKMLEKRRDDLREKAAFYPQQVAAAEAAVVGSINDVYYLICSENAEDIEKRVMFYVLRN